MPEIPDPPRQRECPTCGPITWLWSPRRSAWVSFVAAGDSETIRRHTCAAVTDLPDWRRPRRATPPTPEYRAARAALRTGPNTPERPAHLTAPTVQERTTDE